MVGTEGQRVAASDRLYLAEQIPMLIVWGARDPIIPVGHGEGAHRALPGSRLEVFDGVGHLPQIEQPARFVAVLEDFLAETEPRALTARSGGLASRSPESRPPGTVRRARQDSNLWPPPPEGGALSS